MDLAINIGLLVLGAAGALAAFGGETWRASHDPLLRRITPRGWVALACMLATLGLGVAKELRSENAVALAQQREADLRAQLRVATEQLRETRQKLAAIEPTLLEAMIVSSAGIRRESDFSTPVLNGQAILAPTSGRNGSSLRLYGGDHVDYRVFCQGADGRDVDFRTVAAGASRPELTLVVGSREYRLSDRGREMIIGPIGQAMPVELRNPHRLRGCSVKMLIESADRSREAAQFEPLLKAIREARAGAKP